MKAKRMLKIECVIIVNNNRKISKIIRKICKALKIKHGPQLDNGKHIDVRTIEGFYLEDRSIKKESFIIKLYKKILYKNN